jgi:hypothetical protein
MCRVKRLVICVLAAGLWVGCGSDTPGGADAGLDSIDQDGDGYTADVDCDDDNRFIYPDAPDPCDGIDQNCDGIIDELFDLDMDGYTTCQGDCRDNDEWSFPDAVEVVDGFDNDCDGIADNNTDAYDDDGDGYSEDQGDCNDDPNGGGALISPGAVEVQLNEDGEPEGFDNDCDGLIDEPLEPCAVIGDLDREAPLAYAHAIDACHFTTQASWNESLGIDERSRGIFADFGNTYVPNAGDSLAILASGVAGDSSDPGFVILDPGSQFQVSVPHPDMQPAMGGCSMADQPTVNDYSEVTMQLLVPTNANAFSFDFNFLSAEFPEWVCTTFDDTFLAMLESQAFTGNVSFDAQGNRVSINIGFFDVCDMDSFYPTETANCTGSAPLAGTGYENLEGGGTGWLTTTAPVVPGEKITLTFMVFDEGDWSWDSAVLLDNFRWEIEEVDGPITVPRELGPPNRFVTAEQVLKK